ncbi:MAG: type II toxin-antitoxin system VapC family toxin [Candidatus Hodarchaeales archaeon]
MSIYLDTNVFYNSYCPVEDDENADWVLQQLNTVFQGVTCEWTIIEMFRAFKKQINLQVINRKDADVAINFFLSDIGELSANGFLKIIPVSRSLIMASREQILNSNLYAADALHASVALSQRVDFFITFDSDFKANLGTIKILNPRGVSFKNKILEYKQKH